MYNKLLNYFENECCISNIFMRKHWLAWYITISAIIIITILYSNVTNFLLKYSVTLGVNALILISLMITYFKLFCEEIKSELKIKNLYLGVLELLQKYRRDSAYFEFQLSKMKKYCKKNNIDNDDIQKFIQYIDEDLDKKIPKDRKKEIFLSVIIPSTISIITAYITNNQIKDIKDIIGVTLSYIFIAFVISFTLYAVLDIKNIMVSRRRNFIELKDVLRNINISETETKKKTPKNSANKRG